MIVVWNRLLDLKPTTVPLFKGWEPAIARLVRMPRRSGRPKTPKTRVKIVRQEMDCAMSTLSSERSAARAAAKALKTKHKVVLSAHSVRRIFRARK